MEAEIPKALWRGYFHQVRILIKIRQDVNAPDDRGRTPLMICSVVADDRWSVSLARTLLEAGAQTRRYDSAGRNAIHYACILQRLPLLRVLLDAMDFEPNRADRRGNTALHYVAATGNSNTTKAVLDKCLHYGDSIDVKNADGLTPLMVAFRNERFDCSSLIREATRTLTERAELSQGSARDIQLNIIMVNSLELSGTGLSDSKSDYSEGKNHKISQKSIDIPMDFRRESYSQSSVKSLSPRQSRRSSRAPLASCRRSVSDFLLKQPGVSMQLVNGWDEEEGDEKIERTRTLSPILAARSGDPVDGQTGHVTNLVDNQQQRSSLAYFRSTTAMSEREKRTSTAFTQSGLNQCSNALEKSTSRCTFEPHECLRHSAHHKPKDAGALSCYSKDVADLLALKRITVAVASRLSVGNDAFNMAELTFNCKPYELFITSVSSDSTPCGNAIYSIPRDSIMSHDPRHSRPTTTSMVGGYQSWRSSVNGLYLSYTDQFTPSYRSPHKSASSSRNTSTVGGPGVLEPMNVTGCDNGEGVTGGGKNGDGVTGGSKKSRRTSTTKVGIPTEVLHRDRKMSVHAAAMEGVQAGRSSHGRKVTLSDSTGGQGSLRTKHHSKPTISITQDS